MKDVLFIDEFLLIVYLKTYAKFTFCIKSPGHVSD